MKKDKLEGTRRMAALKKKRSTVQSTKSTVYTHRYNTHFIESVRVQLVHTHSKEGKTKYIRKRFFGSNPPQDIAIDF